MFDGFDEVPLAERATISQWLSQEMRRYGDSVFILTSRPTAYKDHYEGKRPTADFSVQDFTPEQQKRFVNQWYLCKERYARGGQITPLVQHKAKQNAAALLEQIEQRPELQAIAVNVLLLNMMARFYRDKQGAELPQRKVELYQDICELQLGRRPKAKGIFLLLNSLSQRQEVLQIVALEMMKRAATNKDGFKQIEQSDLLALMASALAERDPDVQPQDFLVQAVQVSELLVERDGGLYEFSHLSFQEFLAASEVVRLKREDLLHDYLELDAWKPTLLFFANLVNPARLLQEAHQRGANYLADQILYERLLRTNLPVAEAQSLRALHQKVRVKLWAKLEDDLKQQWKDADYETYCLMLTAVGKQPGQYPTPEEVLNFPCDELKAIDGLWVKYSNGHFGFSVQKQIYVECGGKLDGNYPSEEVWESFGDRVGWRIKGEWMNYSELAPSISSSQGIFPWGWWVGGLLWFLFAQRLVNCSTPQS